MHLPVLLTEVVMLMNIKADGTYIDGTLGAGGHSRAIAELLNEGGRLLAIDCDPQAVSRAHALLHDMNCCTPVQGNYADMKEIAAAYGVESADGILLDLGMSSDQVDAAARGFSFQREGPLDMRMNPSEGETAADLVNRLDGQALADLLWRYGEERASRRIADMILQARKRQPICTTRQLAHLVEKVKGGRRGRQHPATKTFQALRIAVNHEMENMELGIEQGLKMLKPSGRMAVITFHSLEDRCVKGLFKQHAGRWESLQAGGRRWEGANPPVKKITRKPVCPTAEEVRANPRARSAKLRVVERIEDDS